MMGMSHLLHDGVETVDLVGRVLDDPLGAIGLVEAVATWDSNESTDESPAVQPPSCPTYP